MFIVAKTLPPRLYSLFLLIGCILIASAAPAQKISVDFYDRDGHTPAIPSGFLSVGGLGTQLTNRNALSTITEAGLNHTRIWIELDRIYRTSTPDFASLDKNLKTIQDAGLHPMGVIYGTPPSEGSRTCSAPWDTYRWGEMAASVVAHVNRRFPRLMRDYEIWNEPELSLCTGSATASLNSYISMFGAAGKAMHAQAKADGQPIRVGGPVIAVLGLAPKWVSGLLNDPASAPYVDFVSFHLYPSGQRDIWAGMNWSTLHKITQSSDRGFASYYKYLESLVRKGSQPNAESTPIYISELNANWAYDLDCCRNHPAYAPLWNSLAITDLLNVVYSGARAVPSQISYFNAVGDYFCIMGQWNSEMNCNPAAMSPYPQFYAYKLFASPKYLDLENGGHMAHSVSPASTTSGLNATAFYTSAGDNVVIVNPTSTAYSGVSVSVRNPGLTSAHGTVYLLNRANGRISSRAIALTPTSGGYSARVAVPAFSTVALSLRP